MKWFTVWPQPQPDCGGQIIKARIQKLLHFIVWLSFEKSSVCGVKQQAGTLLPRSRKLCSKPWVHCKFMVFLTSRLNLFQLQQPKNDKRMTNQS